MKNRIMFILVFCLSLSACTYIPLGGTKSCYSPNREQSKADGFYICEYRPQNDIFYYSDSLITIKIKILDVYAEECHAEKRRFPPYLKEHYYCDTNSIQLIVRFIIDSSTTKSFRGFSEHANEWWNLRMNCYVSDEMYEEYYSRDVHEICIDDQDLIYYGNLSSIDTLCLPIVFGDAYNDLVWPKHGKRDIVLIGKIVFIVDKPGTKDLKIINDKYLEKRDWKLEIIDKPWYNYLKTTKEMDSLYGR